MTLRARGSQHSSKGIFYQPLVPTVSQETTHLTHTTFTGLLKEICGSARPEDIRGGSRFMLYNGPLRAPEFTQNDHTVKESEYQYLQDVLW